MDDSIQMITLPDGTTAVFVRAMDYGDVVIAFFLLILTVLYIYDIWVRHRKLWSQ